MRPDSLPRVSEVAEYVETLWLDGVGPDDGARLRTLLAQTDDKPRAKLLADTLDRATGRVLEEDRSPSRKTGELDNRGSHFYLALYWAQELARQSEDDELAQRVQPLAERLERDERQILEELSAVQGSPVELGGYFRPDPERAAAAMRPSATLNEALDETLAAL